jgi:hypothetical protein
MIFWTGSSNRDGAYTGWRCSWSAASAMRVDRLADRTEANVASARTSVPAPVASEEMVVQLVASTNIVAKCVTLDRRGPGIRSVRER